MDTKIIDSENFSSIEWDDDGYFKYFEFSGFYMEGGVIGSAFAECSFVGVEWYWSLFSFSDFIQCRFTDCVFRGVSFMDVRFVECELVNCRFVRDNLDSPCSFERTIAYGGSVEGGEGFQPQFKG